MEYTILGPLEVRNEGALLPLAKRKHRALLAMLLLHSGEVVPADALVEALWPKTLPDRPVATLHSYVARVRRVIEPDRAAGAPNKRLLTRSPGYLLEVGLDELDALRFDRLTSQGREAADRDDHATAVDCLTRALAEWRGPAVAEFRDEPFAEGAAIRLEELRLAAVEDRVGSELALGRTDVVGELEALVAVHPYRERLWEHLVLALYRAGRQAEALRRLQDVRQVLADIGVDPGEPLRLLESAVLTQDPELARPSARPAVIPVPSKRPPAPAATTVTGAPPSWLARSQPLVGRGEELAWLDQRWEETLGGRSQLVLLRGEPGIGKTRLAAEALHRLTGARLVLAGRCSEEPLLPHEPYVEALQRAVATDPTALHAIGSQAHHLRSFLPDHAHLLPPTEEGPVDPATGRYLMYTAVTVLIAALNEGEPAVLMLDDLQWADGSTLRLLGHLIEAPLLDRLLVLGTYRDTEAGLGHPLIDSAAEWARRELVADLALEGLDRPAVAELVAHQTGGPADERADELADRLHARTEGNPLFVHEVIRNLGPAASTDRLEEVPANVRALLLRRIGRLPLAGRRALNAASLVGRRIDLGLLARALGRNPAELADDLEPAVVAGLLVDRPELGLVFSHDLVRDVLEGTLSPARATALHRAIGEALTVRHADRLDPHLGSIAHHFALAAADGDPGPAVRYALRAGQHALDLLAHDDAVARYEEGLAALERAGSDERRARLDLLLGLSTARFRAGDGAGSRWAGAEALDLAREVGTAEELGRAARGATEDIWHDQETLALAAEALEEANSALTGEPTDERVRVLLQLAHIDGLLDRVDEAIAASHEAIDTARTIGHPNLVAWAFNEGMEVILHDEPLANRLALAEEMMAAAAEADDRESVMLAHSVYRVLRLEAGDLDGFNRAGARYEELVGELGIPRYLAGRAQRRSMIAALRGEFERAEADAEEMIFHQPSDEFLEGYAASMFVLRMEQGRMAELETMLVDILNRSNRPAWRAGLGLIRAEAGRDDEAREVIVPMLDAVGELPRGQTWLITQAVLAQAAAWSAPERAGALTPLLEPHADRLVLVGTGAACLGSVRRYLGLLARAEERIEDAEGHLRQSLAVHEAVEAWVWATWDRLDLATVLRARDGPGDRSEAGDLMTTGLADADRLGLAGRLVRQARALG